MEDLTATTVYNQADLIIYTVESLQPIFDFVDRLDGVKQSEDHHPEGDVLIHSLQCLDIAFRETDDIDLLLATLLHDVGKFDNSLGHEHIAVEWLKDHVSVKTLFLIENHMKFWHYILGDMRKLGKCSAIVNHPWLPELNQLCRFDKMGRKKVHNPEYDKQKIVDRLNKSGLKHFRNNQEGREVK